MNQVKVDYKGLCIGVAIGMASTTFFFAHAMSLSHECESVIDVEYKRIGKKYVPETVVRKPVRDGQRCLLAEAGL